MYLGFTKQKVMKKKFFQLWNSKGEELSPPFTPNQPVQNDLFTMISEKYSLDLSNQNQVKNAKRIELFASYILLLISTFLTLCLGHMNQQSWKEAAFQTKYPYFATLLNCNIDLLHFEIIRILTYWLCRRLFENKLSGSIPESLCALVNLQTL